MEVAAVAGPIAKLLPKLLSVMDKKWKQLDSLEVDAGFIRRDLDAIQEIMARSSRGSISDDWIQGLRSLADDMEDCIDSFQVGKTTRISFVAKIAKLKKRSKDTLEQLQLRNSIGIGIAGAATAPAAPDLTAACTEDPEEQLLALLVRSQSEEEERKLKVISVAGFGVGMTRLAHKIYSDSDVRSQFPLHAWVRAAPGMSVHKLLREIHDQLLSKAQAEHGASSSSSKSIPQVNGDAEDGTSASHHRLTGLLKTGR
jgi:hypothetical protein